MSVLDTLESLEAVGSRIEKERILTQAENKDLLRRVFSLSYDPYVDFGVKKFTKPTNTVASCVDDDTIVSIFADLLQRLSTRELTGNAARDAVAGAFGPMNATQRKWCERILLKNLRVGVQAKTINKVWPNLIVGFTVQLATVLETKVEEGKVVTELDYVQVTDGVRYCVEPKLDGLRCIAVKHNGIVTLHTRNGNVIDTLDHVKREIEELPFDDIVLDGEAMGKSWEHSASVVMSSKSRKDTSELYYNVFDVVTYNEWIEQRSMTIFAQRRALLEKVTSQLPIKAKTRRVPQIACDSDETLIECYERFLSEGYEGVMVKDYDAVYCFGRSDAIQKLKPEVTHEGTIVGWFKGRDNTRHENGFGGFIVLLENGVTSRVGSGFSDTERESIMRDGPDTLIGSICECKSQPPLTPDGHMRFPVFKRFRQVSDVDERVLAAYETYKGSK